MRRRNGRKLPNWVFYIGIVATAAILAGGVLLLAAKDYVSGGICVAVALFCTGELRRLRRRFGEIAKV